MRQFFTDNNGQIKVMQWPNMPLWIWLFATAIKMLTTGTVATAFNAIATIAIIIWTIMEIKDGASYFRRTLGAVVLILMLYSLIF